MTERLCPFCRKSNNDPNAKFCMYCGNELNLESENNQDFPYSIDVPKQTYVYGTDIPETYDYNSQKTYLGQNKLVLLSFIFGILGLLVIPGLGGFIALILAAIALSEKKPGYQIAWIAIIIGIFSFVIAAIYGVMFWMIFGKVSTFMVFF